MNTNITYREFEPDPRLKDFIKAYWYFKVQTKTIKYFDILPDGYFDLLIVIKGNQIVDVKLTGIWNKKISISYSENTEIFGIRFKPLSIRGLFEFHIGEILNDSLSFALKDLKIDAQFLLEGLCRFPENLIKYLDSHFLLRISSIETDPRIQKGFELIYTSKGSLPVNSISNEIGLSSRQLHRKVSSMIGIGVKDYSQIVRFKSTLKNVKLHKSDYLDYYDQSHYIREMKKYTGFTPEKLNLKENDRFIQFYEFERI